MTEESKVKYSTHYYNKNPTKTSYNMVLVFQNQNHAAFNQRCTPYTKLRDSV